MTLSPDSGSGGEFSGRDDELSSSDNNSGNAPLRLTVFNGAQKRLSFDAPEEGTSSLYDDGDLVFQSRPEPGSLAPCQSPKSSLINGIVADAKPRI